ncbi:1735_t:CDS:2, partial [Paraglomus occultum]
DDEYSLDLHCLGDTFLFNIGVGQNNTKAFSVAWNLRYNHVMAIHNLASNGEGIQKNEQTAFLLLQVAARRSKNAETCHLLGTFYKRGYGVDADY